MATHRKEIYREIMSGLTNTFSGTPSMDIRFGSPRSNTPTPNIVAYIAGEFLRRDMASMDIYSEIRELQFKVEIRGSDVQTPMESIYDYADLVKNAVVNNPDVYEKVLDAQLESVVYDFSDEGDKPVVVSTSEFTLLYELDTNYPVVIDEPDEPEDPEPVLPIITLTNIHYEDPYIYASFSADTPVVFFSKWKKGTGSYSNNYQSDATGTTANFVFETSGSTFGNTFTVSTYGIDLSGNTSTSITGNTSYL